MGAENKKSKNQIRRERAKAKKAAEREQQQKPEEALSLKTDSEVPVPDLQQKEQSGVDNIDYVNDETQAAEQVDLVEDDELNSDPNFARYKSIMDKFYTDNSGGRNEKHETDSNGMGQIFFSDDEEDGERGSSVEANGSGGLSKKKARKLRKPGLAELKATAPKPELVEWFDADANDPQLVVQLKSARGAVPVPDHWQQKRAYLAGKRGIKKAPFDLPDYIKVTGIMDMRDSLKEDDQTLRQKMRERVQPKMGQLDVDYQKLHDAFFKLQTKPRIYKYGEVYYEGKENEMDFSKFRPGKLSPKLVEALNIPPNAPPPYLLNMQRYGPPPSYPGLKIPGLNAPIPPGAQWGFQPGGYGRPPLDEKGVPLYGDVYGLQGQSDKHLSTTLGVKPETRRWGELIDDDSQEEEEDEDEEDEEDEEEGQQPRVDEGEGYVDEEAAYAAQKREEQEEQQPHIELRKSKKRQSDVEDEYLADNPNDEPRELYQVLQQKESSATGFLGNRNTYEIPSSQRKRRRFDDVEVAVDPSQIDEKSGIDETELKQKYEEEQADEERATFQNDLDNLIQSEVAKKRQRQN